MTQTADYDISTILDSYAPEPGNLIPLLQEVQDSLGYLPAETMEQIAEFLKIPESRVYGVATFYAQFYLSRQGRYKVKVCQGTACHVRGSKRILDSISRKLGIRTGETTPDYKFTLERVACFGSCALAPVMVVNDKVYGNVNSAEAEKLLESLE